MQTLLFLLSAPSLPSNSNLCPGTGLNCHPPPEPAGRLWSPCMPPRIFHIMQLPHFVITYLGDCQFNFTSHWTTSTMRKEPVHSGHLPTIVAGIEKALSQYLGNESSTVTPHLWSVHLQIFLLVNIYLLTPSQSSRDRRGHSQTHARAVKTPSVPMCTLPVEADPVRLCLLISVFILETRVLF